MACGARRGPGADLRAIPNGHRVHFSMTRHPLRVLVRVLAQMIVANVIPVVSALAGTPDGHSVWPLDAARSLATQAELICMRICMTDRRVS